MAQVQTETKANGAERKARGSSPIAITFIDAKGNKDAKRVAMDTTGVHVVVGKDTKDYDVSAYPAPVILALASYAVSIRGKTQVANHGENDGSNAFQLMDDLHAEFVGGRLYPKGAEGAPRGKPFDAELYAEAYRQTLAYMAKRNWKRTVKDKEGNVTSETPIKPLPDQAFQDLIVQLKTQDKTKRDARIAGWSKIAVYRKIFGTLKLNKIDVTAAETVDDAF